MKLIFYMFLMVFLFLSCNYYTAKAVKDVNGNDIITQKQFDYAVLVVSNLSGQYNVSGEFVVPYSNLYDCKYRYLISVYNFKSAFKQIGINNPIIVPNDINHHRNLKVLTVDGWAIFEPATKRIKYPNEPWWME